MHRFLLLIFIIVYLQEASSDDAIDLTWAVDENTIFWRNTQRFNFTQKTAEIRNDGWYAANDFCTEEHGGTHLDAPYHFNKLGWKVGDIPLSRLIVTGVKIDLSSTVNTFQDSARLLPRHLELWEELHGYIPNNSVVLVRFGWSQYYSNRTKYLGIDTNNKFHFPGISAKAAEWIVNTKKIVGVGVDTASVDAGMDVIAHQLFSSNQIYGLENVNIPNELPENDFTLYVMPMKIKEGTGAPTRIFAIPYGSPALADPWVPSVESNLYERADEMSGASHKDVWYFHYIYFICLVNIIYNRF